jgi:hypothetical protein
MLNFYYETKYVTHDNNGNLFRPFADNGFGYDVLKLQGY